MSLDERPQSSVAHVLVRVWLPDRPGALGLVASRIGAVRGDIVGIDVLEQGTGVAVDEFAVDLADIELVSVLVHEIEQVDGVSVEDVSIVGSFPDARLDALESATALCGCESVDELHGALVTLIQAEFLADWTALVAGGHTRGDLGHRPARRCRARRARLPARRRRRTSPRGSVAPTTSRWRRWPATRPCCCSAERAIRSGDGNGPSSSRWPGSPTGHGSLLARAQPSTMVLTKRSS